MLLLFEYNFFFLFFGKFRKLFLWTIFQLLADRFEVCVESAIVGEGLIDIMAVTRSNQKKKHEDKVHTRYKNPNFGVVISDKVYTFLYLRRAGGVSRA